METEQIIIKLPEKKRGRRSNQFKIEYEKQLKEFAESLKQFNELVREKIGKPNFKISSRGWCYQLEGYNKINKSEFDKCDKIIDECRKKGYLPLDFVEPDVERKFLNVEKISENYTNPFEYLEKKLNYIRDINEFKKDVAFWESQEYYIQMIVEKKDVRNLFEDITKKYHIPIANARGWSDLIARGKLANNFNEAEKLGLKIVLLYYADFDPAGKLIKKKLRKNLRDIRKATGWVPDNLIIDKFGLTFRFIENNGLMWIDNLITGSKRNIGKIYEKYKAGRKLAKNEKLYDYEIKYIEKYDIRKCEANAILPIADIAIEHCEKTIQKYLGNNPFETYNQKIQERQEEVLEIMDSINYKERIDKILEDLENLRQVF